MQHPGPASKGQASCYPSPMFVLYLDEFGHDGIYDPSDPAHRHHPLFGLAGFVVEAARVRAVDRGFLRLKRSFFAPEIAAAWTLKGVRPERFEAKELRNRRDLRFTGAVLDLLRTERAHVFVQGVKKTVGPLYKTDAVYNSRVQAVLRSFEHFLRSRGDGSTGQGIVVMDQRGHAQDERLLASAQSHLFSGVLPGGKFKRIAESPLLVPSHWYHGVQAADVVARCVGQVWRARLCGEAAYRKVEELLGPKLDPLAFIDSAERSSIYIR